MSIKTIMPETSGIQGQSKRLSLIMFKIWKKAPEPDKVKTKSKEETTVMDKAAEMPENTAENGIQGEMDTDKFICYVIEDLSARVGSNPEKGEVERFDNLSEAITKFKECREREDADQTGMAKAVFGFGINGKEFDVLRVKNNQNCVPIEFTQNGVENSRFKSELQALYQEAGLDRAEVYRGERRRKQRIW